MGNVFLHPPLRNLHSGRILSFIRKSGLPIRCIRQCPQHAKQPETGQNARDQFCILSGWGKMDLTFAERLVSMGGKRVNVLVVDDELDFREMLTEFLKMCGFSVFVAGDGQEAIEVFDNNQIDMVIMDLIMPKTWGDQSVRHMRKVRPDLGVIIITGDWANESLEPLQEECGSFTVLRKPFLLDTLLFLIKRVLQQNKIALEQSNSPLSRISFGESPNANA